MSDEWAKATQEIAKASGKFAELAEKVGGFVTKVIGPASNQVGTILEDWTRYYRYKNLLAIADKVEAIHVRRKIQGKTIPIPPRIAIPMLEFASLEEDETLQEIWARLIANSTDPNFKESIHPSYVEIIRQLTPDEALILQAFCAIESFPILFTQFVPAGAHNALLGMRKAPGVIRHKAFYEDIFAYFLVWCGNLTLKRPQDGRIYLDNLQRLQLIEIGYNFTEGGRRLLLGSRIVGANTNSDVVETVKSALARNEYLRMSTFGEDFIAACIKPK